MESVNEITNFWQFADKHWFAVLIVVAMFFTFIASAITAILNFCNRVFVRRVNIKAHGWPPAHCNCMTHLIV
jgi:hypothetical protein